MDPIRKLPAPEDGKRVETGPVQFGDDWPGYFFRGDDAARLRHTLEVVGKYFHAKSYEEGKSKDFSDMPSEVWLYLGMIMGLSWRLKDCDLNERRKVVMWRRPRS